MVIFVGSAAKFAIRHIDIDNVAKNISSIFILVYMMTIRVSGMKTQPCRNRIAASHSSRDSCWFSHQVKKLVNTELTELLL